VAGRALTNFNTNPLEVLTRIKNNLEPIGALLRDIDGTAIDVTGLTILARMVKVLDATVKINNAAATIDDATAGKVSYAPTGTDMDTPGDYAFYFVDDAATDRVFPYDGAKFIVRVINEEDR